MNKYQVKEYFQWGLLKLEPLQYLSVSQSEYPDSYSVVQDKTKKSIRVSKKAFENYKQLGKFVAV